MNNIVIDNVLHLLKGIPGGRMMVCIFSEAGYCGVGFHVACVIKIFMPVPFSCHLSA